MAPNTEIDIFDNTSEYMPNNYLIQNTDSRQSTKRKHDTYSNDNNHNTDDENRGKRPGRKPMNEGYGDDDEDPKVKRKVQNRAAQRAFRERKEKHVKDLERKIKHVQDSHVYATTKLYKENQQLRAIVFQLESQLIALTGTQLEMTEKPNTPLIEKKPGKSWLASIDPSVPLSIINSFPSNPLPPLQIRPSSPMSISKPSEKTTSADDNKKQIKITTNEPLVNKTRTQLPKKAESKPNQNFTFAISTPATLRALKDNDLFRKNQVIQAVPLYPNHSHPANSLLDKHKTLPTPPSPLIHEYTSSVASSCSGGDEDDEDKQHSFDQDILLLSEELRSALNPFFATSSDDFYMPI